jgi:predicted glutamine amidotransferase
MCRWNAYVGQPILVEELLYRTQHGLIAQSRQASEGFELLNGDGTLRRMYPDVERFQRLQPDDRVVVSEPLGPLEGVWREVPERTAVIVQPGADERRPFVALAP